MPMKQTAEQVALPDAPDRRAGELFSLRVGCSKTVAFEIEGSLNTSANGKVRIMSKVEVSPSSGCPCLGA
jgi:hypothetical protein